ncbi:hypothetical protein D3C80_1276920 [compost metagenome]
MPTTVITPASFPPAANSGADSAFTPAINNPCTWCRPRADLRVQRLQFGSTRCARLKQRLGLQRRALYGGQKGIEHQADGQAE